MRDWSAAGESFPSRDGGIGRRSGLKIRRPLRSWGFDPPSRHQNISSRIYGLQRVQCFRAKSVPKLYPKCTQGSPHRHHNDASAGTDSSGRDAICCGFLQWNRRDIRLRKMMGRTLGGRAAELKAIYSEHLPRTDRPLLLSEETFSGPLSMLAAVEAQFDTAAFRSLIPGHSHEQIYGL